MALRYTVLLPLLAFFVLLSSAWPRTVVNQLYQQGQHEVVAADETLSFEHILPWRNDMPGIGVPQRPAHLFLTIKGAGNIEGSPEPAATLHALHVIQTAPAGGFSAWIDFHLFSKPGDRDFVWRPKDDSLVDPDQPFFTTQLGRYGVIEVSTHNGPRFEGYGLKYVIIAEMGDGVLLKSTEQVIEMSS